MASPEIEALTQALARLPGLGPRSARRAVLHLMKKRETALAPLLRALEQVNENLSVCATCGNVDTDRSLQRSAPIRAATRACSASSRRCRTSGRSTARGCSRAASTCSAAGSRRSKGVRPEDLGIDTLVGRVAAGGIDEVVLAMNATLEGQTTAHYLAERLERFPVRLTQLAHGLPVGGELDYLDEGTLAQALRARRPSRSA